jgi:hypothetical protein
MKKVLLLCLAALTIVFNPAAAATINGSHFIIPPAKSKYSNTKAAVTNLRLQLWAKYTLNDTALLQKYFVQVVVDSIIPYWYGTRWDFNGTTQTPGSGYIACGYFVSTVLRDAGLPVNRVKMGQANSEEMIRTLAEKKDTKLFYDKPLANVLAYIQQKGAGLYIIGLDCHVGFILADGKGCWFIHAKWFGEKAVVKEAAATSGILYWSRYRMVAKISNSQKLLAAWLTGSGL